MLCELSVSAVNILFFRNLRVLRGKSFRLRVLRASAVNNLFLRDLRAIRGESFRLLFVLRLNSFLLRELRGESSLPSNGDIIT
jgi:hypothetical protein